MANKKYTEFSSLAPTPERLLLHADPTTGALNGTTVAALIGGTQTALVLPLESYNVDAGLFVMIDTSFAIGSITQVGDMAILQWFISKDDTADALWFEVDAQSAYLEFQLPAAAGNYWLQMVIVAITDTVLNAFVIYTSDTQPNFYIGKMTPTWSVLGGIHVYFGCEDAPANCLTFHYAYGQLFRAPSV